MSDMFRSFTDPSPIRRTLAVALILISLVVVAVAEHDIQSRPDAQMRGSKMLWRVVCLNALGAAAYFQWGRRESLTPS